MIPGTLCYPYNRILLTTYLDLVPTPCLCPHLTQVSWLLPAVSFWHLPCWPKPHVVRKGVPLCLSQDTDPWFQKLRRQNLMMPFFETPCNLTPQKIRNRFKTRHLCNDHILMFQFAVTFLPSLRKESLRNLSYRAKTLLIALSFFKSFILRKKKWFHF